MTWEPGSKAGGGRLAGRNTELRFADSSPFFTIALLYDFLVICLSFLSRITIVVAGSIMAPQNVHVPIPGTCEYVTLHGKNDSTCVMKLRSLRWGDYPGLYEWTQ